MSDAPKTLQLWPLVPKHVACSGLRALRRGIVHGQAWLWFVYCPDTSCSRWKVTRVRIRDIDSFREDGERVEVARKASRTAAYAAIEEDANVLDAIGPLSRSTADFGTRGAD